MKKRLPMKTIFVVCALLGCVLALVAYRHDAKLKGEQLELTIARMSSGITAAEADRLIGSGPDEIIQVSGVFMNNTTLLAAANSKAAAYGEPQLYDCRIYQSGPVTAVVAVDGDGNVAGRYTSK